MPAQRTEFAEALGADARMPALLGTLHELDQGFHSLAKQITLGRPDAGTPTRNGTHRLDKGVLTEAMVIDIGRANHRVIVGKGVAITPLARDKAREMKLEIVRDKP